MNNIHLLNHTPKAEVQTTIVALLKEQGFRITEIDFNRPWGGFVRVAEEHAEKFLQHYFDGVEFHHTPGATLTPKILAVAPHVRLSWQYHHFRAELWRVIYGPVGVMRSESDVQSMPQIFNTDEVIHIPQGERHRGVGLENWGLIAEIWQHVDPLHQSNEHDIIRVQDDFSRT